jgi:hypothetical protein
MTDTPDTFASVSAGDLFACGLRTDGTLACWGNSGRGETDVPAGTFVSLSASTGDGGAVCALRTDDTLACWGGYDMGTPPAQ